MALRLGIGALLLAALIAAFSLQQRTDPLGGDLAPDAFDANGGARVAQVLATDFPERRAGSDGDTALAVRIADLLRNAMPTAAVAVDEFRADTPDGKRQLRNVSATLLGQPGPEIVVVAHRDALDRTSQAELSGTGALIALARAAGQSRFQHTIRFVSTTGASGGGLTGATRLARNLPGDPAAVIVLGDLSGSADRPPEVVAWSNAKAAGPDRLQRTVEHALRAENLHPVSTEGLWAQLVHRGLPATLGEQGELNQGGAPTVLLSAGGALRPAADAAVDLGRFTGYGRAALRSLRALDQLDGSVGPQQSGIVVVGQVLPVWALRILLLALLIPVLAAALVVGLTLARDGHPLLTGAAWTAGCAAGPLIVALIALTLGRIGAVWPSAPAPFGDGAVQTGTGAWALLVALTAVMVVTVAVARPALARDASGRAEPTRVTVAGGVFALLALVSVALIVVNPVSALLVLPALLAWPAAISPTPAIAPLHRLGLAAVGLLLPAAAVATVVTSLEVPIAQIPWWLVLLVAGGHVTPVSVVLISLVAGALIATILMLIPPAVHQRARRLGHGGRRFVRERRERRARRAPTELPDDVETDDPQPESVPTV